jgi:hypothetical protein
MNKREREKEKSLFFFGKENKQKFLIAVILWSNKDFVVVFLAT